MPVTLNGRTWALSDFAPWGFRQNWMPFFEDLVAELSGFQGSILRDQAAASAASARTSAAQAAASAGQAGTGTATGLVYGAALKSLVTASDVVSVFVYDTRRDSDGGAWTEKCRGTSWYNEPLNTATRGATRRFPTVALIVVRAASVTIYDAHDLDAGGVPRMWMVFNNATSGSMYYGAGRHVLALNGSIWWVGLYGLQKISFATDGAQRWDEAYRYAHTAPIVGRNTNAWVAISNGGAVAIVNRDCNAVHAAVLPGAPLDSFGLPIPTVAVATASGVSVIHPSGAVYDITDASGHTRVHITSAGRLFAVRGSNASLVEVGLLPYADLAATAWRIGFYSGPGSAGVLRASLDGAVAALTDTAQGSSRGLRLLAEDTGNPGAGMIAHAAIDFATGWMPGDIRGAWLCDSATGSVAASVELITNGDFSGGTTGWTTGNGGVLDVVSGEARLTGNGTTNYAYFQQIIPTVPGQTYLLSFSGRVVSGEFSAVQILRGDTGVSLSPSAVIPGAATTQTPCMVSFEAASATTVIRFTVSSAPSPASPRLYIDNVSVRLALPDRSYKSKGLTVNGTLTRTALPCGLASVSGFSAANYLEQPYNPDLDFGTGDWFFAFWFTTTTAGHFFDRWAGGGARLRAFVSTGKLSLGVTGSSGSVFPVTVTDIVDGALHMAVLLRRGTTLEIWLDGVREAVTDASSVGSVTNANAVMRLGIGQDGSTPLGSGKLLLFRTAAYAPTSAQIRRMYEDERALVIGGQPALLGGTSSNVTALASNPDTGSLLVGTSDGVSVFSGLARTAYHDGSSAAGAVASDSITSVSAMGPHLLVGTSTNAGLITEARIGRDLMRGGVADTATLAPSAVTIDATPTDISPRLYVGEGETRVVRSLITVRQYGTSAGQVASYELRYLVRRDLGGALALVGSVNLTMIHETSAGMDATVSVDATAQTVTERVTGLAATRLVWTVERQVLPLTMGENYAA
jgi:hypothetical protein